MLADSGFTFTEDPKEADLVILNTCAVREHAEQRVFGNLGILTHTKKENPEQVICLCGCMAQRPEVAEKVRGAGFENVTVDNATYFNAALTRVSYYHKENSAEAEELAELLKVVGPGSVYCYDSDQSGGWSEDYDILVLVGDPSVGGFAPQGAQV